MSVPWKSISSRLRFKNWPLMAWVVLVIAVAVTVGTTYVAVELYAITDHPMEYSTR